MAERHKSEDPSLESESEGLRELEWVLAKSLLDANARTTQAFEYHLLGTYRDDASSDCEQMQESIRQAIDEHEKIIENLEVAARAVSEMRREESVELPSE